MLTVEYLLGRLNVRADWASRNFQDSSEWLLSLFWNTKSIPRNLFKVMIPRVGSFCIKRMPSDTMLTVVENRSTQLSKRWFPTELETSGATVCFSPIFNDRESFKVKAEQVDVILTTPSSPAQPWYSQVLELSVNKPLLLPQLSNILVNL